MCYMVMKLHVFVKCVTWWWMLVKCINNLFRFAARHVDIANNWHYGQHMATRRFGSQVSDIDHQSDSVLKMLV